MSKGFDLSCCLTFHREGELVQPTLDSVVRTVEYARNQGLRVEVLATLDNSDSDTKSIVSSNEHIFDSIEIRNYGQPSKSRNDLVNRSKGKYVSILDGDDLYSENWLYLAARLADDSNERSGAVYHPEYSYYFYERDFEVHVTSHQAHHQSKSHFVRHLNSMDIPDLKSVVLLDNFWPVTAVADRSIYLQQPFLEDLREKSLGIEDWAFNIETLYRGLKHVIVPSTVMFVRVKENGSQNDRNFSEGMLPAVPLGANLYSALK